MSKINIKINKEEFLKKIQYSYESLENKKEVVIDTMSSFKITLTQGNMQFMTHNSEYTLISNYKDINIQIPEEEIVLIVNGGNLYNAVKSFSTKEFDFIIEDLKITIKSGRRRFSLMYKTSAIFPDFSNVKLTTEVEIKGFKKVVDKSLFCLSKDKLTPILNCVWFGDDYSLSGDGRRFSSVKYKSPIKNVAIPSKSVSLVRSILDETENPKLTYAHDGSERVFFGINDEYLVEINLLNHRYPKQLGNNIKDFKSKVSCKTKDVLEVVENFSHMLTDSFNKLNMKIDKNKIGFSINTESCVADDEVETTSNENISSTVEIVCNYKYMLDVLKEIKDEEAFIMEINDTGTICNIKNRDKDFIHPICLIGSAN